MINEINQTNTIPNANGSPVPDAVNSVNRVVQGAHQAIDRFAGSATPQVQHLAETVVEAKDALRDKAAQLGDGWYDMTESLRDRVRARPLTALACAAALGMLVARLRG